MGVDQVLAQRLFQGVDETDVSQLSQPGILADPLTEVLRNGARVLLAQAIPAEVAALLSLLKRASSSQTRAASIDRIASDPPR